MIPTIEDIVRGVKDGSIGFNQACRWLEDHVEAARSAGIADAEERRYFAAMALPTAFKVYEAGYTGDPKGEETMPILVAGVACEMADALLAALNKPHAQGKV